MSHLNEVRLKQKRITQEQFDKVAEREDKRKKAKDKANKDLKGLSKAELIAIIEDLRD